MVMEYSLKPVLSRKLKNGDWIVLADGAAPLVVKEELANCLVYNSNSLKDYDDDILSTLKESGFYAGALSEKMFPPKENKSLLWKVIRLTLFIIGAFSVMTTFVLTIFNGIPGGYEIINHSIPTLINIIFVIIFSLLTTLFHELMHIIFARTYRHRTGGLRFQVNKATATVSMTHIWVWSFTSRLAALSAGLIFDFFLLACLLLMNLFIINWMLTIAISILWLRIIWQFRFHKNCDGQLIALSILDNPILGIEQEDQSDKEVKIWNKLGVLGHFINILIVVYWLIPFIWSFASSFF